ncbi:carbohydrate porin [Weeksellaceae bacterium TAE3-ERU29]|nr:carbohydrate porin [Weeksellaceae bacterium TAE3-ERU29]
MKLKVFLAILGCSALINAQEKKSDYNPHSLESHGYLRTGLGTSLSGGEMVQFQAPETSYKARFGNEANHYSELQFDYKYQKENSDESYEMVYMMATYLEYASLANTTAIRPETAQLYFKWNNIYKGMDIWVGRRYFQRLNVDILDNFWLNPAQNSDVGFGVEEIPMTENTILDASILKFSQELKDPTAKEELLNSYKLDLRWKGLKVNNDLTLNFLTQFGVRPELKDYEYYKKLYGTSLGFWTTYQKGFFYNGISSIYRKGTNMIENPYSGRNFLEFNDAGTHLYDLDKAYDVQITSDFRYDDFSKNGFLGVIAYQYKNYGVQTAMGNDRTLKHLNVNGRYSRYLTDKFRLTFDAAYDNVDIKDGVSGNIFKLTFSPEIAWKKGMFARPSIRPFITYATWSEDLMGQVGVFNNNDIYADKTSGFTAGLQLEIWW